MKIPLFGKSGPKLVTAGLVCASPATGPAAIQPNAANATTIPFTIFDISALPAFSVIICHLSTASRLCDAIWMSGRLVLGLCSRETRGYLLERFRAKACPGLDPGWIPVRVKKTRQNKNLGQAVAANRSNCHVDTECGFPRLQLHAAEAQFADTYSGRRRLAADRQDARGARRSQGPCRTQFRQIRPGLSQSFVR